MSYASEVLSDSPLGYWPMDEASGTTMVDASGNARNGTIETGTVVGATGLVPSEADTSYDLNAGGEGGTVTAASWMVPGSNVFTVECWVYLTAYDADGTILMARSDIAAANNTTQKAWAVSVDGNGAVGGRWYNQAGSTFLPLSANGALTLNELHHVIASWDGSNIRYYVDAVKVAELAATGSLVAFATNTKQLAFGRSSSGTVSTYSYTGRIGHGALYATALSAERIMEHYLSGLGETVLGYSAEILADTPEAYYRLGEASGTTMTDSSGNARHGSHTPGAGSIAYSQTGLVEDDADTALKYTSPAQSDKASATWMDPNPDTNLIVSAALASTTFGSETAANAFNGTATACWTSNGVATGTLRAQLSGASVVTAYAVRRRDDFANRNPTAWTFEGSNDGSTWTTLDTRTGLTWPTAGELKEFTFSNATSYLYYRLNITANAGDTYLSVAELILQPRSDAGVSIEILTDVQSLSGTLRTLVSRYNGTTSNPGWSLRIDSAVLNAYVMGGGGAIAASKTLLLGKHHIVLVVGILGSMRLYVDGLLAATNTYTTSLAASTNNLVIGRTAGAAEPAGTNLVLDEVAIYKKPLSAARIKKHYWAATAGAYSSATIISGGVAIETDTGLAGTVMIPTIVSGGVAIETDTGRPGTVLIPSTVVGGVAIETDTGLTGTTLLATIVSGGVAVETDTGLAGTLLLAVIISGGIAIETDTGLLGNTSGLILGGIAIETDTALGGTLPVFIVGGIAIETDTALAGILPALTDTTNRVGGRVRGGYASVEWEPPVVLGPIDDPVVPPGSPADYDIGKNYDTLNVYGVPTYPTVDSQPVYSVTTVRKKKAIDRIIVGGKDITWWRGAHTPTPDYQLISPMLYGPATLSLPQVAATFENPGVGALKFLRKGSSVVVQRVTEEGDILSTDYKGVIIAYRISGGDLSLDIGGELSGRAALMNRQVPIFKSYKDLGWYVFGAINGLVKFTPRLGPETGIKLYSFGGMSLADYINQLCGIGQDLDGNIYSLMPNASGVYKFEPKDRETVHGTIYFDDERMKPDMTQDVAEEPNRIYATGVTPSGMKIKFGVYPGLKQGDPPPYPMNDDSPFGAGTTDGDTDTGDGVSVMIHKLVVSKYLEYASDDYPGGYDADVTRAIKDLQEDAGLAQTGNMNPKTWKSLYDLDATGYSLNWSHIEPAAQRSYTRRWSRTASGAVRSKNADYDPTRLKVDINIDVGSGYTRNQIKRFAKTELRTEDNWVGSVSSKLAVSQGIHMPGDPVDADDIMPLRDVKPGMNLWAPLWGPDGTLFHVSGASVSDFGRAVSLVLDTQFRDTTKVWQIIERNYETRMSPTRAWINQHRRSQMTNDSVTTWDEIGGIIDSSVKIKKQQWIVFPVLAGQEGTIQRLRLKTNPNAEFCTAMFGHRIDPRKLQRLIGNPLTPEGALNWQDPVILDRLDKENVLIYIAGNDEAPCGYYPYDKQDSGPLTGRWDDDAGIAYRTMKHPVLWVAVFAEDAGRIPAGRILWPQQEEGS